VRRPRKRRYLISPGARIPSCRVFHLEHDERDAARAQAPRGREPGDAAANDGDWNLLGALWRREAQAIPEPVTDSRRLVNESPGNFAGALARQAKERHTEELATVQLQCHEEPRETAGVRSAIRG
jgi:hypothetical protein